MHRDNDEIWPVALRRKASRSSLQSCRAEEYINEWYEHFAENTPLLVGRVEWSHGLGGRYESTAGTSIESFMTYAVTITFCVLEYEDPSSLTFERA
jgi:hypothetical protein